MGTARPADGMSFVIAPSISPAAWGEEGTGSGLIVSFDTWDNNGTDTAPAIDVKWGGTADANIIASQSMAGQREGGRAPAGPLLTDADGNPVPLDTGGHFTNVVINIDPDGTLDLWYGGIQVFSNLQITNWTGINAPMYGFGARTGGANEAHWIDNLCINGFTPGPVSFLVEPVDTTALEGQTATFTAMADGTIPYTYQWLTNDVPVPGATGESWTTPPTTEAMNGLQVSVTASNEFSSATSSNATLTVDISPRVVSVRSQGTNEVVVLFTRPVDLTSGTYSFPAGPGFEATRMFGASESEVVVIVDTPLVRDTPYQIQIADVVSQADMSAILPNPTDISFFYGGGTFCTDFEAGVADNSFVSGTAVVGGPSGTDGILHLTDDDMTGACGSLYVSNLTSGVTVNLLNAHWKSRVGGDLNGHADGYSLNWASDLPTGCGTFTAEEGAGTGVSFTVDLYDVSGSGPDTGIEIKWNGSRIAFQHIERDATGDPVDNLTKDTFVDAYASVDPDGRAVFSYDGHTISAVIPGWTGIANGAFLLAGRTGGQTDNIWIDDLCINGFSFGPITITQDIADQTVTSGQSASFTLGVDGQPPYSVQWFSNDVAVASADTLTYRTPALSSGANGAQYYAIASNYSGSVTSMVATVTVQATDGGTLQFTRGAGGDLVIDWSDPNAVLQSTSSLTQPIDWQPVAGATPPFTVPIDTSVVTNVYFRLMVP